MSSMLQLSSERDTLKAKPRILFIVPASYAALQKKGVAHMIFERDEQGFFDKVITVHPLADKDQVIVFNAHYSLYEFNLNQFLYPSKWKWLLVPLLPFKFFFMLRKLLILIRNEKIDAIRATDPYLMGIIAWLLAFITRIPFCISTHIDYDKAFTLNPKTGLKKLMRICSKWIPAFVLPKARLVMPIRECYAKQLMMKGARKECIRVIPHGIDFNFLPDQDVKKLFDIPSDKKLISFVGRLSKENYLDDILKALEKLAQIRHDFILLIVGGGEMEAEIKEWLAHRAWLNTAVRLLGFQSNSIGRSLRHISDVSLCLFAGFSLIEAAAAASPLIAYDVEWHYELVENQVTGFLIKEHNIDAVVESINYLLDHPDEAIAMGQQARNRAIQYYDIKKTSQIKQNYYTELLNEATSS